MQGCLNRKILQNTQNNPSALLNFDTASINIF